MELALLLCRLSDPDPFVLEVRDVNRIAGLPEVDLADTRLVR